jgi:hypothetical protein
MSFPQYPEVKDSGVEWLGEVPAHWNHGKVRYFESWSLVLLAALVLFLGSRYLMYGKSDLALPK